MRLARLGTVLVLHVVASCAREPPADTADPKDTGSQPMPANGPAPLFSEVAGEAGLAFVHNSGAFGRKWLPETMGSGCAWLDYDGDGDPDALLLSGRDFDGHPTGGRQTPALFRNDAGRFTEVTKAAGLALGTYAMGATCGDYDTDGDVDVYVTALGPNRLFRNDGARFVDVAPALGLDDPGFGSSASWLDFDRDGDLDLFTLNYVEWTPETDLFCTLDGHGKSYCTPEAYRGSASRLYRNDGGTFTDVSGTAGIHDPTAKALGIVCVDFDADGWVDVFVANDTQPNWLFHNEGDGTFTEQGVVSGVAFDESGRARGAMGVDAADFDGSGRPGLVIGNFSNEMLSLYDNEGSGLFVDVARTTGVGSASLLTLAFGTLFLDYDLDGHQDIFVANGHVETDVQRVQSRVSYAQPPHLFRNLGDGRFVDLAPQSEVLRAPMVARGAASADYDADGDLDILVTTVGGPAKLFRNDGADGAHALRLRLVGGSGSDPHGFGARVRVQVGGRTLTDWARAAHSYCSQSEGILTFGLGRASRAEQVEVFWPAGKISRIAGVEAGSLITVREADAGSPADQSERSPGSK